MQCVEEIVYCENLQNLTLHRHSTHQLLFVKSGRVTVYIGEKAYPIHEPSVVFISNLENHRIVIHSMQYQRYYINISPQQVYQLANQHFFYGSIFLNRPPQFSNVLPVGEIARELDCFMSLLLAESAHAGEDADSTLSIFKTIMLLLYHRYPDRFVQGDSVQSDMVMQIRRLIDENPANPALSIENLSRRFHISPSHLSHSFKAVTGYSVRRYRMIGQTAIAKELLKTTDQPITQIIAAAGFSDMSNFSRYFKKETGCTPTGYRALYRR